MRNMNGIRVKRTHQSLTVAILLLVLLMMFSACTKKKPAPPRTVPVIVESADKKNVPLQLKAIGMSRRIMVCRSRPLWAEKWKGVFSGRTGG